MVLRMRWLVARQLPQQRSCLLQIDATEPFREPVIHYRQGLPSGIVSTLPLPQPAEAHRGSEFPGLGLLIAGNGEGAMETGFGTLLSRVGLP